jgi:prepilin-type N-terminal cleavage/methylation domain-containing protein
MTMRIPSGPARPGFTLLEVLLATMIGVFILAGLYVAVGLHLRHAQIARDLVEQSTLVRAVLDRMARDVRQTLGPIPPAALATPSSTPGAGAGGSTAGTGTAGGTAAATSTTGSTTTASGTSSATSNTTASVGTGGFLFNVGVQGDNGRLALCTSQVPRVAGPADPSGPPVNADVRRITYWLMGGGDKPLGLARQEIALVTSDDATSDPPDDPALVIAGEVVDLKFQYYDGSAWQDSWDGTAAGPDGQTPMGPPLAVAISLTVRTPDGAGTKTYRRVVVIQTANGTPQQTTNTGTGS